MKKCDMTGDCKKPIAYIDAKGWIYCDHHGQRRKATVRCRKLKPAELEKINAEKPIRYEVV